MQFTESELSVSRWFLQLKNGDQEAMEILWKFYFPRLVRLAQQRFVADRNPVYGADDAAQSAMFALYRHATNGRLDGVANRDDLWRLLVAATKHRVIDQVRRQQRDKRGGGMQFFEIHAGLAAPEPTPEVLAICDEQFTELLGKLRDATLRSVAILRMEGLSNLEIAEQLGVSERTIERKLNLIRTDWQKEIDASETQ